MSVIIPAAPAFLLKQRRDAADTQA